MESTGKWTFLANIVLVKVQYKTGWGSHPRHPLHTHWVCLFHILSAPSPPYSTHTFSGCLPLAGLYLHSSPPCIFQQSFIPSLTSSSVTPLANLQGVWIPVASHQAERKSNLDTESKSATIQIDTWLILYSLSLSLSLMSLTSTSTSITNTTTCSSPVNTTSIASKMPCDLTLKHLDDVDIDTAELIRSNGPKSKDIPVCFPPKSQSIGTSSTTSTLVWLRTSRMSWPWRLQVWNRTYPHSPQTHSNR